MNPVSKQSSTDYAKYYQTVFDNTYDAMFIEAIDGQILDVNPAACNLTGYSREELLAMNVAQLLPSNHQMPVESVIREELETGGFSFSGWNVRKDGTHIRVDVRATSFLEGGEERIIVIVRDITDQEKAERQTAKQRLVLESLHQLALGLMRRHDLQDVLNSIIQHACQLFNTDNGYVYMQANETDMIEIKVAYGNYIGYVGYKRRIGTGLAGEVWQSGEPRAIENYQLWDGRDRDPKWKDVMTAIGIPLNTRGKVVGVIGLDITGHSRCFCQEDFTTFQRLAELASIAIENAFLVKELNTSEEQFHSLFANMSEGVALHDAIFDEQGNIVNYRIVDINTQYSKITGFHRKDVVGKLATDAYHCNSAPYLDEFSKTILLRKPFYFETYFEPYKNFFSISVAPWKESGFASIFADITERKQTEEKLFYMSYHDSLTGVYNRAYFEAELKQLAGSDIKIALVIADVDRLKTINDMFGHEEGDRFLIRATDLLRQKFRKGDIIARIGGDEFAVILKNATEVEVSSICSGIRLELDRLLSDDIIHLPMQLSIGYAVSVEGKVNTLELFRVADDKLYRDKLRRKVHSRSAIVQTLKQMLAERDYLTEGHGKRLQDMIVHLGRVMEWSESILGDLQLFAQFHDIGKIGIPDRILHKPGPLSQQEREEMNRHCEIGQRIAQSSEDLYPIADWILKHHERWDGKGYPLGLKGEEIPIECRILAIVDAYDAMTSDRPYRSALSHKDAIDEIRRCAGKQFDPNLSLKFIQMFEPCYISLRSSCD